MATTVESNDKHQYVEFDEYIDFQLRKTRGNIKWTEIATALVGLAVLFLAYLLIFVLLDHWFIAGGFSQTARVVMLCVLLATIAAWLAWKVALPYWRQVNTLFAARTIEQAEPTLQSSLLNLVDLQQAERPIREEVRNSMEKRAAVTLAHIDIEHTVDRRPLMWTSYALLALVVLCCAYALLSPKRITNSLWRAVLPAAQVSAPTQTEIRDVKPGDVVVPLGSRVEVIVELTGQTPDDVTLLYTTEDRRSLDEPLEMRETEEGRREYRCVLTGENGRGVLQSMEYRIVAGDAQSPTFHISVVQPPSARVTELQYEYPAYMEFDSRTDITGHIDAWEGTKVKLTAEANMPLTTAVIQFADSPDADNKAEEIPLRIIDGTQLEAEWHLKLRADGSFPKHYRIRCKNKRGDSDPDPTLYNVTIRPDQPPEVALVDPVGDIERPANAIVPLVVYARDPDFKLAYVTLRIESHETAIPSEMVYEGDRQQFSGTHDFKLERLRLKPGDEIEFWIEARDNKQPIGNRKNTPRIKILITDPVTPEQVEQQLEADKQRQEEALEPEEGQQQPEGAENAEPQDADEQSETETDPQADEQPPEDGGEAAAEEEGQPSDEQGAQSSSEQQQLDPENPDDTGEVIEKLYKRMQEQQQESEEGGEPQGEEQQDGEQQQQSDQQPGDQQQDPKQSEKGDQQSPPEGEQGPQDSPSEGEQAGGEQSDQEGPAEPMPSEDQPQASEGQDQSGSEGAGEQEGQQDGQPSGDQQGARGNRKEDSSERKETEDAEGEQRPADGGPDDSKQKPTEGSERPADDSGQDARQQQGGESEQGTASPEKNSDAKPGAQNSKPGEDQSQSDPDSQRSAPPGDAQRNEQEPQQQKKGDVERPDSAQPPSDDSEKPEPGEAPPKGEGTPEGPPSGETPPPGDSAIKPDQPPEGGGSSGESTPSPAEGEGDAPMPGEQRDGDAQQAAEPQQGDQSGEQQPGESGQQGESGGEQQQGESGGEPSEQSGDDSGGDSQAAQGGEGEQQSTQPGEQASGKGDQATDQSSGKPGDPQGQQQGGSKSAQGAPAGANAQGDPQQGASGDGDTSSNAAADKANLEFAKEAADLVLKELQGELDRGEIDQELLDELGWNEEQVRKFTEHLKNRLDAPPAETPESLARRRQFEETLKTLDLKSSYGSRRDAGTPSTKADSIGPRRSRVPAEYRDDYDAFTRSRAKRGKTSAP